MTPWAPDSMPDSSFATPVSGWYLPLWLQVFLAALVALLLAELIGRGLARSRVRR